PTRRRRRRAPRPTAADARAAMKDLRRARQTPRSEFAESLRRGVLVGVAALVLIVPPALHFGAKPAKPPVREHVARRADFGAEPASQDARRLADWVADARDNGARWFAVL